MPENFQENIFNTEALSIIHNIKQDKSVEDTLDSDTEDIAFFMFLAKIKAGGSIYFSSIANKDKEMKE